MENVLEHWDLRTSGPALNQPIPTKQSLHFRAACLPFIIFDRQAGPGRVVHLVASAESQLAAQSCCFSVAGGSCRGNTVTHWSTNFREEPLGCRLWDAISKHVAALPCSRLLVIEMCSKCGQRRSVGRKRGERRL